MGMNPTLAAMYNTHGVGAAVAEEQVKIAHLELFCKAAAAQGIDLAQLDDATKNALFVDFTQKLAQEEGEEAAEEEAEEKEEESEEEAKESAARREFAAMSEWREKNAQADFLGRRMAHAFWDEYNEISKQAAEEQKFQPAPKKTLAGLGEGQIKRGPKGTLVMEEAKKKGLGQKIKDLGSKGVDWVRKNPGKAGGIAAGTAAVGAGAYAAHRALKNRGEEKKEASAFDYEAAEQGLKIAAAAGWDTQECANLLNAQLTLGVSESEKVAYAGNSYEDGLNIRGLELLEEVGYPVDWRQVFGG